MTRYLTADKAFPLTEWCMKQDSGMRVADHGYLLLIFFCMKYFSNYEADAVVREDDNGQRYIKHIEYLRERKAGKDEREAWGIPSFSMENFLEPITKEEYDNFGITWDWNPRTGKYRKLANS